MLAAVVVSRKKLGSSAVVLGILGFVPIADIICAVIMHKKLRELDRES